MRAEIERAIDNPATITGISYGLASLDTVTNGISAGQTISILGETTVGKSWLMVSILASLFKKGKVLVVPTEMPAKSYCFRLASYLTKVNASSIKHGALKRTSDEYKRYIAMLNDLETNPNLVWSPSARISDIVDMMRNGDYIAVLVDSLSEAVSPKGDGIYDQTRAKSQLLQEASRETGIPHIRTVQVGRKNMLSADSIFIPSIHDAKGASEVEENSNVMLSIYNQHAHRQNSGVEWHDIEKQCDLFSGKHYGFLVRVLKLRDEEMPGYKEANMIMGWLPGIGIVDYQDAINFYGRAK
jgi:replicative DNA helicase